MASPRTRRAAVTTTSHRHQNIALGLKVPPCVHLTPRG
jgi:hypothetical protein